MKYNRILLILISCFFISGAIVFAQEKRNPVKIEGKTFLPIKVLARPYSNIYKEKDESKGTVLENVPAFQSYYVYEKPTPLELESEQGWYEVGSDNRGTVIGWMRSEDICEWKQTMCLTYTHPQGRKPVLMFEKKRDLVSLINDLPNNRINRTQEYYRSIESQNLPNNFPIKSVEPSKAIDLDKEFYLLPILDFQPIDIENREGRLLKITAVAGTSPDARGATDIREDKKYLNMAVEGVSEISPEKLAKLKVDLVWVMDTTVSMEPHLLKTIDVVREVSKQISSAPQLKDSLRVGFWGYRDCLDDIPGIEYTTYNYTPELQPVDTFMNTIKTINVTKTDSVDWAEDMFSGLNDALVNTSWNQDALRLIILVGDAPGHEPGHKWNLSGQNESTIRMFADDNAIYIYSLFLKDKRAKKYFNTATGQFQTVSMNKGSGGESTYWNIDTNNLDDFAKVTTSLTETIKTLLSYTKPGKPVLKDIPSDADIKTADGTKNEYKNIDRIDSKAAAWLDSDSFTQEKPLAVQNGSIVPEYERLAQRMIRAAMVEWIGSHTGAKSPRDITAWVTDKDLINPNIQSLEVRLLINKRQLDSLVTVLTDVIAAGTKGKISGGDFFEMLQSTAATAAREPDQIKNAQNMANSGLIPEFLIGLPYKSQLMAISNELWNSWSMDEQDDFLNSLRAKIEAYKDTHDNSEGWIALNEGDDPGEYVYPINLSLLP